MIALLSAPTILGLCPLRPTTVRVDVATEGLSRLGDDSRSTAFIKPLTHEPL